MVRLFGTDGVRGIANGDLTCDLAVKLGAAGAYVLTSRIKKPRIIVGSDTRRSGAMLVSALAAGICSVGGDVLLVGVIPTPAMAHLVRTYDCDAAVMVSASHNTMEYNGIKWFDERGLKLPDEIEDRIEAMVRGQEKPSFPTGEGVGVIMNVKRAVDEYIDFLVSTSRCELSGIRVAVDTANGASSGIAARVFTRLGADVVSFCDEPDGSNINDNCGSMHPERLRQFVTSHGADVGFAFDGDADRVIACDEYGNIIDGDGVLGICAMNMKERGVLKGDTLVVTVMSNLGLKKKMAEQGISVAETVVGDRYVLEEMLKHGYSIGGEQSGHIIFLDHNTTGDGMLSAIQLMNVMKETGRRASSLAKEIPIFPQVLVNVRVSQECKAEALASELLSAAADGARRELGDAGRVLVRASGTEPLIRIMLEGQDDRQIEELALRIAAVLTESYGGEIV